MCIGKSVKIFSPFLTSTSTPIYFVYLPAILKIVFFVKTTSQPVFFLKYKIGNRKVKTKEPLEMANKAIVQLKEVLDVASKLD